MGAIRTLLGFWRGQWPWLHNAYAQTDKHTLGHGEQKQCMGCELAIISIGLGFGVAIKIDNSLPLCKENMPQRINVGGLTTP